MVHDHILERGAAFRALVNAGKAWVMAYHECVAIAEGLPGKERRAELEKLTWNAIKKAHEFIETEEAAKNARHRILAIQAIALITHGSFIAKSKGAATTLDEAATETGEAEATSLNGITQTIHRQTNKECRTSFQQLVKGT
jgi:hypothetical protein